MVLDGTVVVSTDGAATVEVLMLQLMMFVLLLLLLLQCHGANSLIDYTHNNFV